MTDAMDAAARAAVSVDEVVNEKNWWIMFRETLEPLVNSRNAEMATQREHFPRTNAKKCIGWLGVVTEAS